MFFVPLNLVVSSLSTTPKAHQHGLPLSSKGFLRDCKQVKKKKKKKKIQVPGTSSVSPNSLSSFPLLAGFVFSCFCISLRFNSRLQHVTTRSLLFLKISSFVGCKTPWRGCCLPCSPDNVVTSRNLSGYWTAV